jgi:hypothetical protein
LVNLTGDHAAELGAALERRLFERGCNCLLLNTNENTNTAALAEISEAGGLIIICLDSDVAVTSGAVEIDSDRLNAEAAVQLLAESGVLV